MADNTTTTSGSNPGGSQSNMLGVDLSQLNVTNLANEGGAGFDLTEADLNNPGAFGQHPPATEHQQTTQHQTQTPPNQQGQQAGQQGQQTPPNQQGQQAGQQNAQQTQTSGNVDIGALIREALTQSAPAIGAAAVSAIQGQNNPQGAGGEPQLTLEELDKKFNVVRLSPETMTALGFDPANATQRESLEGLLHATAKMATSIAEHRVQQQFKQFQSGLSPVMSYVQQAQMTELKNTFFSQNPELKDHEQLLGAIYSQLKTTGFQGTNEQWFAETARVAKTILDRVRGSGGTNAGGGSSGAGQQQQQNNNNPGSQTTHRMTTLSGGGQGGASQGSGGGGGQADPTWNVWA